MCQLASVIASELHPSIHTHNTQESAILCNDNDGVEENKRAAAGRDAAREMSCDGEGVDRNNEMVILFVDAVLNAMVMLLMDVRMRVTCATIAIYAPWISTTTTTTATKEGQCLLHIHQPQGRAELS